MPEMLGKPWMTEEKNFNKKTGCLSSEHQGTQAIMPEAESDDIVILHIYLGIGWTSLQRIQIFSNKAH